MNGPRGTLATLWVNKVTIGESRFTVDKFLALVIVKEGGLLSGLFVIIGMVATGRGSLTDCQTGHSRCQQP